MKKKDIIVKSALVLSIAGMATACDNKRSAPGASDDSKNAQRLTVPNPDKKPIVDGKAAVITAEMRKQKAQEILDSSRANLAKIANESDAQQKILNNAKNPSEAIPALERIAVLEQLALIEKAKVDEAMAEIDLADSEIATVTLSALKVALSKKVEINQSEVAVIDGKIHKLQLSQKSVNDPDIVPLITALQKTKSSLSREIDSSESQIKSIDADIAHQSLLAQSAKDRKSLFSTQKSLAKATGDQVPELTQKVAQLDKLAQMSGLVLQKSKVDMDLKKAKARVASLSAPSLSNYGISDAKRQGRIKQAKSVVQNLTAKRTGVLQNIDAQIKGLLTVPKSQSQKDAQAMVKNIQKSKASLLASIAKIEAEMNAIQVEVEKADIVLDKKILIQAIVAQNIEDIKSEGESAIPEMEKLGAQMKIALWGVDSAMVAYREAIGKTPILEIELWDLKEALELHDLAFEIVDMQDELANSNQDAVAKAKMQETIDNAKANFSRKGISFNALTKAGIFTISGVHSSSNKAGPQ